MPKQKQILVGSDVVAEKVGVRPNTVTYWARLRGMPALSIGGQYVFDLVKSLEWVEANGVKGASVRRNRQLKAA